MRFLLPQKNEIGFTFIWLIIVAAVLIVATALFLSSRTTTNTIESPKEPRKIGLFQSVKRLDGVADGFKEGMTELGYVDGVDVVYEYQNSDLDPQKGKQIAKNFVDGNFDLVLAIAEAPGQMYEATKTYNKIVPIVFTNVNDPVKLGIVKSLQTSGNHVTGIRNEAVLITTKKIEFLKQIKPSIKKIAIFAPPPESIVPPNAFPDAVEALKQVAPKFGMEIVTYTLKTTGESSTAELQTITDAIKPNEIDAIMIVSGDITSFKDNAKIVIAFAKRLKIATMVTSLRDVENGALLNYNHVPADLGKQASIMADKIFRGTSPSAIPIEAPRKFDLNVNLKTAAEIDIVIPDSLLIIADKKIE